MIEYSLFSNRQPIIKYLSTLFYILTHIIPRLTVLWQLLKPCVIANLTAASPVSLQKPLSYTLLPFTDGDDRWPLDRSQVGSLGFQGLHAESFAQRSKSVHVRRDEKVRSTTSMKLVPVRATVYHHVAHGEWQCAQSSQITHNFHESLAKSFRMHPINEQFHNKVTPTQTQCINPHMRGRTILVVNTETNPWIP